MKKYNEKRILGWILTLNLLIIGFLGFFSYLILTLITIAFGEDSQIFLFINDMINLIFGLLILFGIPGTVIGVLLLITGNRANIIDEFDKLKNKGVFTEEEFDIEKKKILEEYEQLKNSKYYYDNSNDNLLKKAFFYKGRINRLQFFLYNLIVLIIFFFLFLFLFFLLETGFIWLSIILFIVLFTILNYIVFIFSIKRLHDINASGWWYILNIITGLLFLILLFFSGTKGDNKFGPQPKKY